MFVTLKQLFTNKLYHSKNIFINMLAVLIMHLNQQRKLGIKFPSVKNPKTNITVNNLIPKLSWICEIEGNNYDFTVGSSVECSEKFVFEGAWDGDFNEAQIKQSQIVFGSGAVLERSRVIFIAPKHILEGLYVFVHKKNKKTCVSNSLCFALNKFNVDTEGEFFRNLSAQLNNAINVASDKGIDKYMPKVIESEEYILYRMLYYNFEVDCLGNVRIHLMLPRKYFNNFSEYRSFLSEKIKRIVDNANSKERKIKYPPITTISKGYDSPTVSILAKQSGCKDALTLDVSIYGVDDSGKEIGNALGFNVYSCKHILAINSKDDSKVNNLRINFEDNLQPIAFEFLATGGVGDDVAFYPFQDQLRNRLFLTGSFGDSMWEKNSKVRPGLSCTVPFMKSITEFRLRAGFCFFPVPFLAARFPVAITKISSTEELHPYSNGTAYDRPICRRIIEEQGIPSDWFGVKKNATAPLILNHNQLFKRAFKETMKRYS